MSAQADPDDIESCARWHRDTAKRERQHVRDGASEWTAELHERWAALLDEAASLVRVVRGIPPRRIDEKA